MYSFILIYVFLYTSLVNQKSHKLTKKPPMIENFLGFLRILTFKEFLRKIFLTIFIKFYVNSWDFGIFNQFSGFF